MFSGGEYDEVARWVVNFVAAHAKRVDPRIEPAVEADGPREGVSFGIRLRRGGALSPAAGAPPLELSFEEARDRRGERAWCDALAGRIRALAVALTAGAGSGGRTAA